MTLSWGQGGIKVHFAKSKIVIPYIQYHFPWIFAGVFLPTDYKVQNIKDLWTLKSLAWWNGPIVVSFILFLIASFIAKKSILF